MTNAQIEKRIEVLNEEYKRLMADNVPLSDLRVINASVEIDSLLETLKPVKFQEFFNVGS